MLLEVSILAAFGAMICWGIGDFFIQRVVRKIGVLEALAYIGIIGSIALFPFVKNELVLLLSLPNILIVVLLGILTFPVALVDFEALKEGKLSVIEVLLTLELPVTIFLAMMFFGEKLSFFEGFIILFIFLGIFLISLERFSWKHHVKKIEKGVFLGIVAAFGMGLVNFLTASSARNLSPLLAIWVPWVIFTFFCFIFLVKRNSLLGFMRDGKKYAWLVITMGFVDTLAWLFYAFAIRYEELSLTTAITESYPAIALLLGLWFNKEKIGWHQYVGVGLALVASVILALFF